MTALSARWRSASSSRSSRRRDGWSTIPEEIWTSQISVAVEALGHVEVRPRDIVAIGITNQRETTIVWDRETGKPIYNAIVWQDRRTAGFCDQLKAARARRIDPAAHWTAD